MERFLVWTVRPLSKLADKGCEKLLVYIASDTGRVVEWEAGSVGNWKCEADKVVEMDFVR